MQTVCLLIQCFLFHYRSQKESKQVKGCLASTIKPNMNPFPKENVSKLLLTKARFLLLFCPKKLQVHVLHYSICSLKNIQDHIIGVLLYLFYVGWDSEAYYARFLAQDQSQSEAELIPKPAQHSFFSYPEFLTIKIEMIHVATEFKVGYQLPKLGDVSLDSELKHLTYLCFCRKTAYLKSRALFRWCLGSCSS